MTRRHTLSPTRGEADFRLVNKTEAPASGPGPADRVVGPGRRAPPWARAQLGLALLPGGVGCFGSVCLVNSAAGVGCRGKVHLALRALVTRRRPGCKWNWLFQSWIYCRLPTVENCTPWAARQGGRGHLIIGGEVSQRLDSLLSY